jgi:hypothetical protein
MRGLRVLLILICVVLPGCKSKQAKTDQLQAEYNRAYKRYYDDCVAPSYGGAGADAALKGTEAKTPSPQEEVAQKQKCAQEAKQAGDLQKQLQAASQ